MTKHNKKEIAQLLKDGKIELARIKCEHIVRTDDMIEAYGIIELYLELLYARVHYISTSTTGEAPPPDLREPVASVIFASGKVKIDELGVVAQQLGFKFGTEWKNDAERSHGTAISNERILRKLSMIPVSASLVNAYMTEIASVYDVEYEPVEEGEDENGEVAMPAPTGVSVPVAPASNLTSAFQSKIVPPAPPSSNAATSDTIGGINSSPSSTSASLSSPRQLILPSHIVSYEGESNDSGLMHGHGRAVYRDGGEYSGLWHEGMRHHGGTMKYADGSLFVGSWVNDKREGQGQAGIPGRGGDVLGDISQRPNYRRVPPTESSAWG